MNTILEEYIGSVIKQVASKLELDDWHYDRLDFENKAQNYFGVIIPTRLSGKYRQNSLVFDIVLKLAPIDERFRVSGAVTAMFAREIYVYSKIFTLFTNLKNGSSISSCVVPKLLYVNSDYCKEAIVIENMCKKGYEPCIKSMFLDVDHIIAGIKALARFHVLTIVLKERNHNLYQEIEANCVPLSEKTNKRFIEILLNRLERALTIFEKSPYESLLLTLKANCVKFIESLFTDVKIVCLCHGDIWKENILFKHEEMIQACLIDFQTARVSSPAFDILYLIASSTDSSLRKQHFHQLLDIYHRTLTKILNEEEIDMDKYSREKFDYDIGVVAPAAVIIANTALWLSNGLQEEGHVRSKQKFSTETEKLEALNRYKEIIKNLLDDIRSYGYVTV